MKKLSLLRHAKSSWDDPVERDFDRPLNGRGHRAARRMGEWLKDNGFSFDHAIASPALRIRQTIEGVEAGLGTRLAPVFDKRIYMASAATLFELIQETPDDVGHLLLIGHNPGLHDLALALAGPTAMAGPAAVAARRMAEGFPTCSLAEFTVASRWRDLAEGGGRLVRFLIPADLPEAVL